MPRSPTVSDWIALLALTAMWGLSFLFTELALRSFTPAALVVSRVAIAAAVLAVILTSRGATLANQGLWWWAQLATMAMLGTILPFHLIAWGQQHIDSATAGVLMAVMPLFVVALAHWFVPGSRITMARAVGFLCGFVGVALVIGPDSSRFARDDRAVWGMLAVLTAALSYAINAVYARRINLEDPVITAAGMMVIATVVSLPGAILDRAAIEWPPTHAALAAILFLGIVSTGIATVLYFKIIRGPGPTFLSLINYLIPGCAVLAGAIVLEESLNAAAYIGLALILAGVGIGEFGGRPRRNSVTLKPAMATPDNHG